MSAVTQANTLSRAYAPPMAGGVDGPPREGGQLGGMQAREGEGVIPRAYNTKTTWERFTSRVTHAFKSWRTDANTDAGASQAAARFNARHEAFSGKINNLVARLASGTNADVSNPDLLATLRNDVKVMHRNAPWASRTDLLSTRMDVELGGLTDDQLARVGDQLSRADTSRLTDRDKVDLQTMQRAVLRHQLARSGEMATLVGGINHGDPGNIEGTDALLGHLDALNDRVTQDLAGLHIPGRGKNDDIISGAISLALRRGGHTPAVLGGMNRNLLNVEHTVRLTSPRVNGERSEIASNQPMLRMLSRAVRDEFLQANTTTFRDDGLRSRMKPIGAGAAHTVCKGEYQQGGGTVSKVHKDDDEELCHPRGGRFGAPAQLKIDQTNPRLLERAVFTSQLDSRLGFNVCVQTDFARHHDKPGIVMGLAPGRTAGDTRGVTGNPGVAQRELMKLQLLDIITGQADRHDGNYLVEQNEAGEITGVKAIDSDFCMGPEPHDAMNIVGKHAVHLPGMPPVIDRDMAAAIRGMSDDDLAALCGDMFDDASLVAAQGRLAALKDHINGLPAENIIDPADWGSDRVTALLTNSFATVPDPESTSGGTKQVPTSYWQRDYPEMSAVIDPRLANLQALGMA